MRIQGKTEADVIISEDSEITGMIIGIVTVAEGIKLIQRGMVIGDLVLKKASTVYMYGMVNGDLYNDGGYLEVFGMVNGRVIRRGGQTLIDPDAKVRDGIN